MRKFFGCLSLVIFLLSFNYVLAFCVEKDLKFLKNLSYEDLNPIIAVIEEEKENKLTEKEKNYPIKYLDKIIETLENIAINKFDIKDNKNISYKQVLEAACKKQNIRFDKNISINDLGITFIKHMFDTTIDKMSKKQKEGLVGSLRDTMDEEQFENFLEKIDGTNGLFVSSGEKIRNLLSEDPLENFILATCLAADIFGSFDIKQPKEKDEQSILYSGIIPAITYIEALRIIKTQAPKNEDNSEFLKMLIIVSIPVLFVLLIFIYIEIKKSPTFAKFIKFLFMCLFVTIILLGIMLALEAAEDYIIPVFIVCVILVSLLLNLMFSIQRKRITKQINKNILKNTNSKILKDNNNIEKKDICKIICPKCNTQNSKTNYSCVKCHNVFTEELKEDKTEHENEIKEKLETPDNKEIKQVDKQNDKTTETSKDENAKQEDKTEHENEIKEKPETSENKEIKQVDKQNDKTIETSKDENVKQEDKTEHENEIKEKSETSDNKEIKQIDKQNDKATETSKDENVKQKKKKKKKKRK